MFKERGECGVVKESDAISQSRRLWDFFRGSSAPYMVSLGITVPVALLASYLFGPEPVIKGQPWWIFLAFVGFGFTFVFWLVYRREAKPSRLFSVFILLDVLAWIVITVQSTLDEVPENHTTYLAPILMLMLLLKPPNLRGTLKGGDAFAVSLVVIALVSHVLHMTGIFPFPHYWYPSRIPAFFHSFGLLDALGLEYRWEGPFGSVSDAAPVGAFLIFYGLLRNRYIRWISLIAGIAITLVAFSWTGIMAIIAGLLVLLWCLPGVGGLAFSRTLRFWVTLVVVVLGALFVTIKDPTLNGRTIIWGEYLQAWVHNPLTGIGGSGITAHLGDWFSNGQGHSFYVDTLLRYGILGFSATVATVILAGVLSGKAMRAGLPQVLALFTVFAAVLISETLILWRYLAIVPFELLLIGTIAAAYLAQTRSGAKSMDSSGSVL